MQLLISVGKLTEISAQHIVDMVQLNSTLLAP